MEVSRVSPQKMPISQNVSYLYLQMKYVTKNKKIAINRLKHSSVPCGEFAKFLKVQFCQIALGSLKTRIVVPR